MCIIKWLCKKYQIKKDTLNPKRLEKAIKILKQLDDIERILNIFKNYHSNNIWSSINIQKITIEYFDKTGTNKALLPLTKLFQEEETIDLLVNEAKTK